MSYTDIQLSYHIRKHGWSTWTKVSYQRTNQDGTEDRVERLWQVYKNGTKKIGGERNSYVPKPITDPQLVEIKKFISDSEADIKLKDVFAEYVYCSVPAKYAKDQCGRLISKTASKTAKDVMAEQLAKSLQKNVDLENQLAELKRQMTDQNNDTAQTMQLILQTLQAQGRNS